MADPKHTPGPWVVNQDRRGAAKLYVREAKLSEVKGATAGRAVAQVTAVVGWEEQAANALLIAAAPELLEALRRLDQAVASIVFHRDDAGTITVKPPEVVELGGELELAHRAAVDAIAMTEDRRG